MFASSTAVQSFTPIKPLYMWAGGKSKLLKRYQGKIPEHGYSTVIEPFFGGGAVSCDFMNKGVAQHFFINDINTEMMSVHKAIKQDCETFIKNVEALASQWNKRNEAKRYKWYYELRTKYWSMPKGEVKTAATLYVLMKMGFNGLWQPSKEHGGKFGTAVGLTDKTAKIDSELIRAWAERLQHATLSSKSYKHMNIPSVPCLIYCDPPYRSSFADYGNGFTDAEQIEVIDWCKQMAQKGHTVVLANRDCGDGFFDNHLSGATVHYFDVTYTLGRKKKTDDGYVATQAREFIAVFQPDGVVAMNDEQYAMVA